MKVDVTNPEFEAFIRKEIEAGRYASADEVVATALMQFIATYQPADDDEIDNEVVAQLNEAYARAMSGEKGLTIEEVREQLLGYRRDVRQERA